MKDKKETAPIKENDKEVKNKEKAVDDFASME